MVSQTEKEGFELAVRRMDAVLASKGGQLGVKVTPRPGWDFPIAPTPRTRGARRLPNVYRAAIFNRDSGAGAHSSRAKDGASPNQILQVDSLGLVGRRARKAL